jgi:hypothetical protein
MLANRVLKSILQSSKLFREKFVNNKKKYNIMTVKNRNHNMTIKRDFGSSSGYMPPNKNPKKFDWTSFIVMICGVYLIDKMNKSR